MMKMNVRTKQFALSIVACLVSSYTLANSPLKTAVNPYPTYKSATGISAAAQIPMEASWLHSIATSTGGVTIPKSFDSNAYWLYMVANNTDYQTYQQTFDAHDCHIPDPARGERANANDATIERTTQYQGLDIYDGAVWQMSLALAATNGNNPVAYAKDVTDYQHFLLYGLPGGFQSYYANNFTYNGSKPIPSGPNAYLFKFIAPSYADNYDVVNKCNMTWTQWEAVTGEEAWAVFLGPIQSIYLLNNGTPNDPSWTAGPRASDFIQSGKNVLSTIQLMQAPNGGVYRNATSSTSTQDYNISLENNFSLYAGLTMFEQALKARVATNTTSLKSLKLANSRANAASMSKLQQMISSDQADINTVNGIKKKMVQFFAGQSTAGDLFNHAGNYFYSSVSQDPSHPDVAPAYGTAFAVDVQTWGATVIATSKKDPNDPNDPDLLKAMTDAYGPDVMYNMLNAAINQSGYRDSTGKLLGVGYTEQEQPKDKDFYELSGEWTFGAINAAITLANYYDHDSTDKDAPTKKADLIALAKQMLAGTASEVSSVDGNPASGTAQLSYLYANKRAAIPFGWYSNKIPSTASTGWSLMVNSCFNPLELGGGSNQAICQLVNAK